MRIDKSQNVIDKTRLFTSSEYDYYKKLMPIFYNTSFAFVKDIYKRIAIKFKSRNKPFIQDVYSKFVPIVVQKSTALAAQTFMLSITAEGYASVPMEGLDSKRMKKFFIYHKKEFFISLLIYAFVMLFGILEFKFLLLTLGVRASLAEIILAQMVLIIASFLPVPGGLGFQEAGHSGLFALLKKGAGLGLVFSLIARIRNLIVMGIGFIVITNFTGKEIVKKYYKNPNNLKTK